MDKLSVRMYDDPGVDMVAEFHRAFGCHIRDEPGMPVLDLQDQQLMDAFAARLHTLANELKRAAEDANARRRYSLGLLLVRLNGHTEETAELAESFEHQDLVAALDALVDTSYFVDGTFLTLGMGHVKPAAQREVHRSNMSKLGADGAPIIKPSGRVAKGPNYSPPDLEPLLLDDGAMQSAIQQGRASLVEKWD